MASFTQQKRDGLIKLFDEQMNNLRAGKVPPKIIRALENAQGEAIAQVFKLMLTNSNLIPFLPVIPFSLLEFYKQADMTKGQSRTGFYQTSLNLKKLVDKTQVPAKPYFIFGIDPGQNEKGKNLITVADMFQSKIRLALTMAEMVALCCHTEVLKSNGVCAVNSRYENNHVIALYTRYSTLEIQYLPANSSHQFWLPSRNFKLVQTPG